jgi:hypothetical protein
MRYLFEGIPTPHRQHPQFRLRLLHIHTALKTPIHKPTRKPTFQLPTQSTVTLLTTTIRPSITHHPISHTIHNHSASSTIPIPRHLHHHKHTQHQLILHLHTLTLSHTSAHPTSNYQPSREKIHELGYWNARIYSHWSVSQRKPVCAGDLLMCVGKKKLGSIAQDSTCNI